MFKKFLILYLTISLLQIVFCQQGWYQLNSGTSYNLRSLCFTDVNTGYVAGYNGTILKTTNGGLNWTTQPTGTGDILYSVDFIGQSGYVVGGYNTTVIFKTTNGGLNWVSQTVAGVSALHCVFMTDSVTAYAVGHNGKIIKTTNGGIYWSIYVTSTYDHLNSIFFVNANTGYAGGTFHMHAGGETYRTNDGGASWVIAGGECYSIFFINTETGFRAGYGISKTTNSGANWTYQSLESGLNSVWFTNLTTGYTAGSTTNSGRIFKTTNEGNNWIMQNIPQTVRLNSIYFIDANTGYAVGDSGTILKTTNGGVTGLVPVGNEIPKEYKLYQNYPNPFNPSTHIEFHISDFGLVNLIVYDMLGREIETLVNDVLKPGIYEIDFDGSNLATGIYFYVMKTEIFTDTKKMILIK